MSQQAQQEPEMASHVMEIIEVTTAVATAHEESLALTVQGYLTCSYIDAGPQVTSEGIQYITGSWVGRRTRQCMSESKGRQPSG